MEGKGNGYLYSIYLENWESNVFTVLEIKKWCHTSEKEMEWYPALIIIQPGISVYLMKVRGKQNSTSAFGKV